MNHLTENLSALDLLPKLNDDAMEQIENILKNKPDKPAF